MIFKNSIRDSIDENGGPKQKKKHPEKAYNRFFEGYTARVIPGKRGSKVRYEYTGEYYSAQLSDRRRLEVKCLYVLLYLLTWVGFILSSIAPVGSNHTWYVGLPQALCVFSLAWMLVALLYYVPAPKLLTIYLRRTMIGFHFRWASICMAASFALLSLASIVWLVLHWTAAGWVEWRCALTYLVCTGCVLAIFSVERHIQYLPVKN